MTKQLEKQLEFEFMKDVRREERKIEIQRFRDRWIEPLALKITLPLGIMGGIGLTYLSKHPEYIEATQSYIKSLF